MITSDHVAAVRAMLLQDLTEYERVVARIERDGSEESLSILMAAAFCEAVFRRLGRGYTIPDIIRLVADERTRFDDPKSDIDPRVGERLVRAVLGDGSIEGLDEEAKGRAQLSLLMGLVDNENLDDAGLDQFLMEARTVADAAIERLA